MKNTIVVLIVLLLYLPVFAQDVVVYTQLDSYLQAEKKNHSLLSCTNKLCVYKCFIEFYDQQNHAGKRSAASARTFMDGPVIYSAALPVEFSRDQRMLYQQYSAATTEPSTALQVLGFVGGITAAALTSKKYHYTGFNDESPLKAYLQSTYHQDHRQ